jgi:Mor family transcriptional regulator
LSKPQSQHIEDDAAVALQTELEQVITQWTGMPLALAAPLAQLLTEGLRERMGGTRVYVPRPRCRPETVLQRVDRDFEIAAMYNGTNVADVMRKHRCSRATVYRAVNKFKQPPRG